MILYTLTISQINYQPIYLIIFISNILSKINYIHAALSYSFKPIVSLSIHFHLFDQSTY